MKGPTREILHSNIGVAAICGDHGDQCNNQSYALKRCYVPSAVEDALIIATGNEDESRVRYLKTLLTASVCIRQTVNIIAETFSYDNLVLPLQRGVYIPVPLARENVGAGDSDLFFPDTDPKEVEAAILGYAYGVHCQTPVRVRVVCIAGKDIDTPDLRSTFLLPGAAFVDMSVATSPKLVTNISCVHDAHAIPARADGMHHIANQEIWKRNVETRQMQACGKLTSAGTMPLQQAIDKLKQLDIAFDEAAFSAAFEADGSVPCFYDPMVAAIAQMFALKGVRNTNRALDTDLDRLAFSGPGFNDFELRKHAAVLVAFGLFLQRGMQQLVLGKTAATVAERLSSLLAPFLVQPYRNFFGTNRMVDAACALVVTSPTPASASASASASGPIPRSGSAIEPELTAVSMLVREEPLGAVPPVEAPKVVTGSVAAVVVDAIGTEVEKHKQELKNSAIEAASKLAAKIVSRYTTSGSKTAEVLHGVVASAAQSATQSSK